MPNGIPPAPPSPLHMCVPSPSPSLLSLFLSGTQIETGKERGSKANWDGFPQRRERGKTHIFPTESRKKIDFQKTQCEQGTPLVESRTATTVLYIVGRGVKRALRGKEKKVLWNFIIKRRRLPLGEREGGDSPPLRARHIKSAIKGERGGGGGGMR